ncbi:MAG: bifunctional diaminohydroxyphosphoribosylaminopyrimidine deaminase/5-amino-6-(5-phosphoribosylamino)uracil reductase RibD, partial [Ginsengibacter sp.]
NEEKKLIASSALYVSLEPCSHYGKTPPCTNLIIKEKIPRVVVGCRDPFKEVAGKGIEKLRNADVQVFTDILEKESKKLNKRFFTFHQKQRPYIILKWTQSANGKIGSETEERILISNDYTNRLVHKWRSEEAAILVGTNTVLKDNPSLTTRFWKGKNPVRIVIDKELKLPSSAKLFSKETNTMIFNFVKNAVEENINFIKTEEENFLPEILLSLYKFNIQSVLVEGGTKTLQSFIDTGLWDEARVITNENMVIENGIAAPEIKNFSLFNQERILGDSISWYHNHNQQKNK